MKHEEINPRHHLYTFVGLHHFGQQRKYTLEPYFNHVVFVAEKADGVVRNGYEIGLCHDLLEDTACTVIELQKALLRFGYSTSDTNHIVSCVIELTDVFTHEKFPDLNRKERKLAESSRLHSISKEAQTVKYFDLMHNTESITKHDQSFAKVYMAEKRDILIGMNKGKRSVYNQVCKMIVNPTS